MSKNKSETQETPNCCRNLNSLCDCAEILQQTKNCCDALKEKDYADCCKQLLSACCKQPDTLAGT